MRGPGHKGPPTNAGRRPRRGTKTAELPRSSHEGSPRPRPLRIKMTRGSVPLRACPPPGPAPPRTPAGGGHLPIGVRPEAQEAAVLLGRGLPVFASSLQLGEAEGEYGEVRSAFCVLSEGSERRAYQLRQGCRPAIDLPLDFVGASSEQAADEVPLQGPSGIRRCRRVSGGHGFPCGPGSGGMQVPPGPWP